MPSTRSLDRRPSCAFATLWSSREPTIRQQMTPGANIAHWRREAGAVDVREQVHIFRGRKEVKDKSHDEMVLHVLPHMLGYRAFCR